MNSFDFGPARAFPHVDVTSDLLADRGAVGLYADQAGGFADERGPSDCRPPIRADSNCNHRKYNYRHGGDAISVSIRISTSGSAVVFEEKAAVGLEQLSLRTAQQHLDQVAQQAAAQQWSYTHFLVTYSTMNWSSAAADPSNCRCRINESCRFALLRTTAPGPPSASVSTPRLLPRFARSVGFAPA